MGFASVASASGAMDPSASRRASSSTRSPRSVYGATASATAENASFRMNSGAPSRYSPLSNVTLPYFSDEENGCMATAADRVCGDWRSCSSAHARSACMVALLSMDASA